MKPNRFNARAPSRIVESLSKEVSIASWSDSLQIFILGITKNCVQTKIWKQAHLWCVSANVYHLGRSSNCVINSGIYHTVRILPMYKKKGKKALKQKEGTKENERELLKAGNLKIWSVRHSSDPPVLINSKVCSLLTRRHFHQVAVSRAILTVLRQIANTEIKMLLTSQLLCQHQHLVGSLVWDAYISLCAWKNGLSHKTYILDSTGSSLHQKMSFFTDSCSSKKLHNSRPHRKPVDVLGIKARSPQFSPRFL